MDKYITLIPVNPLLDLGFNSIKEYESSNLFRLIKSNVLKRDNYQCEYLDCICKSQHKLKATRIIFIGFKHATYLGIGCASIISLCQPCYDLNLKHSDVIFAITGLRPKHGRSDPRIGKDFFTVRFARSQSTAQAIYDSLGSNQAIVKRFIEETKIGSFYSTYLELEKQKP